MGAALAVEMGETRISNTLDDRLVAFGLGACVGLCLFEPVARIAAMVHIVLPQTLTNVGCLLPGQKQINPLPGKCADTALPHVLEQIVSLGGQRSQLRAAIAGGAQIFSHGTSSPAAAASPSLSRLEIGSRNVAAIKEALANTAIPLVAEEVGGNCGRTVTFYVHTGAIFVRAIGAEEQLFAALGQNAKPPSAMQEGTMSYGR